jgi:hypothetical protein
MASKGAPRSGVVIAVSGAKLTVAWDTGGETSVYPGPGTVSVVKRAASGRKAAPGTKAAAAKKAALGTKAAATKASAKKASVKKSR